MRRLLALAVLASALQAGAAEDLQGVWAWGSPRRSAEVPFLRITRSGEGWTVETKHYMHAYFVGGTRDVSLRPGHLEFTYWYEPLGRWAQCSLDVAGERMDGECDGEPSAGTWGRLPAHLWRMDARPARIARPAAVRIGLERLDGAEAADLLGKRLALVTDDTGVDSRGRRSIDLLFHDRRWQLVSVFRPQAGAGRDARTRLPVVPLDGLQARELAAVDVLVYDMQDSGSRNAGSFTALEQALQAGAAAGKTLVVLDRPNPLGGAVQGGAAPIPLRHGLTPGELASFLNAGVGARLRVVSLEGWRRDMRYEATGLAWVPPSPDLASLESARHYPGLSLFEPTNLSVGRGTDQAFQEIGAPWLDAEALVRRLEAYRLPGVRFQPVRFTPAAPRDGKFDGMAVRGVRFIVADAERYDATRAAVAAMIELRALHPERFEVTAPQRFDRLAGTARLREQVLAGASLAQATKGWQAAEERFRQAVARYLLYE